MTAAAILSCHHGKSDMSKQQKEEWNTHRLPPDSIFMPLHHLLIPPSIHVFHQPAVIDIRPPMRHSYPACHAIIVSIEHIMSCVATQSRDAKSCVSQGRMSNISSRLCACLCWVCCSWDARIRYWLRRLYSCHCCVCCSWDARFCVSTWLAPSLF